MKSYNKKQNIFLNKILTTFITLEKTRIANFLANNLDILAINLAKELAYIGLPLVYIAAITGVSINDLNKLKKVIH